jgi:hypothetical protein
VETLKFCAELFGCFGAAITLATALVVILGRRYRRSTQMSRPARTAAGSSVQEDGDGPHRLDTRS